MLVQIILLFLCGSVSLESPKCSFEPVKLSIFRDGTSNVDVDIENQMDHLAKNITSGVPNESTIFVNSLGDQVVELVSFNKTGLDLSWVKKWSIRKEVKQFGDTLSALALSNELNARYSVNQYKSRAEMVILLVSDTSKLDALPSLLAKKKTFVVVFGSSIPNIYNSTASREDHLYLVRNKDELEAVTVRILEQLACDSRFYCDTDMYSLKKGSRCKNCSVPCGDDLTKRTKTCETRCPFIRRTSSKEDLEQKPSMSPVAEVDTVIEDNKEVVVAVVIGVFCVFCGLLIFGIVWCMYKKQKKRPLTPVPSEVTLPKTLAPIGLDFDKMPVEESGMDASSQEQATLLSDVQSAQTDVHDPTQRKSEGEASINSAEDVDTCNMVLPLKDKRTMDLNAHYSGENVVFLHKSRRGEGARPITGQEEA
ncbi:uncharacterized protein LOC128551963 isoform X2 [Mercenaria mercenaria]|uniref:uncharacterized protein LOC128551963 isoform X2 n=1 Tax=Mercenaria mercenaria TaxID=6596 RepID=UPI00234F68CF|nr:uncharacterized protein LOC128551963 isoform X2 [Mercenaria mercenaria]